MNNKIHEDLHSLLSEIESAIKVCRTITLELQPSQKYTKESIEKEIILYEDVKMQIANYFMNDIVDANYLNDLLSKYNNNNKCSTYIRKAIAMAGLSIMYQIRISSEHNNEICLNNFIEVNELNLKHCLYNLHKTLKEGYFISNNEIVYIHNIPVSLRIYNLDTGEQEDINKLMGEVLK